MVTRFYLPSSTAVMPAVTPAAHWNTTTAYTQHYCDTAKQGTAIAAGTAQTKDTTTGHTRLDRQYVSAGIVGATITGTFSAVIAAAESSNSANAWLDFVIRVVSSDGATVRGTLYAGSANTAVSATSTAENYEIPLTTAATRTKSAISLSSVTAVTGDRIVIECGYKASATSSTYTVTSTYGDAVAAADYALTVGLTTTLDPWVELSQTLSFATPAPIEETGDGGTNTAAITTGNSGGTRSHPFDSVTNTLAAFTWSSDHPHPAFPLSMEIAPTGGGKSYGEWICAGPAWRLRQYFWFDILPSQTMWLAWVGRGATRYAVIGLSTQGWLQLRNAAQTVIAQGAAGEILTTGTWMRFEWRGNPGTGLNGTMDGAMYVGDSTTPVSSLSVTGQTMTAGDITAVRPFSRNSTETYLDVVYTAGIIFAADGGAYFGPEPSVTAIQQPTRHMQAVHRATEW